jgi:hypothetical protein
MGAWAPGTNLSLVEWVEAHYDPKAPPVKAIRVFETCVPGATYAVTLRDEGEDELIWERRPGLTGNTAQVLEIPVDPPRKVRVVRAYVANNLGSQWSEIDTIGLVAVSPVPEDMRRKPPRLRLGTKLMLLCVVLGIAAWLAVFAFKPSAEEKSGSTTAAPTAIAPPPTSVDGAKMTRWSTDMAGMAAAGTVWATEVVGRSSEYQSSDWSARQALGAPNVFPTHGDAKQAWAPQQKNGGQEWIEVRFPTVANAGSVVVVETFNSGALARIDDLSDPAAPVLLWRDSTTAIAESRVLSLELAEPRPISHLRILLDTTRANGWNEIDAIGLVPRK